MRLNPLITRDPASGLPLVVTRLACPETGVTIEGAFDLGWIGNLTADQLEFAGLLLRNRGNVQKVASDMGVSYNTARARLDAIVTALGGDGQEEEAAAPRVDRGDVLRRVQAGEITPEEAVAQLRGGR